MGYRYPSFLLLTLAVFWQQCRGYVHEEHEEHTIRGSMLDDVMSVQMTGDFLQDDSSTLRCFESSDELRQAVEAYKGYNNIDTTLAATYGWPINHWCVSGVTDFSNLFHRKTKFNEPLSNWDLSSATSVSGMFMSALSFDQDVSGWDVSKVRDFSRMFAAAKNFNSNIRGWNTTNAEDMSYMFMHAHAFHHDLFETWDVKRVQHMQNMFDDSRAMVDPDYDTNAWPLLSPQQGLPTIKLTSKERRMREQLQEQQQQPSCGLRSCN